MHLWRAVCRRIQAIRDYFVRPQTEDEWYNNQW